MPYYVYRNANGITMRAWREVDRRDDPPADGYVRVSTLDGEHSCTFGVGTPRATQGQEVLKGFRELEQQLGTTECVRQTKCSPRHVKRVWSQDD